MQKRALSYRQSENGNQWFIMEAQGNEKKIVRVEHSEEACKRFLGL
jgi:hypothetical protein